MDFQNVENSVCVLHSYAKYTTTTVSLPFYTRVRTAQLIEARISGLNVKGSYDIQLTPCLGRCCHGNNNGCVQLFERVWMQFLTFSLACLPWVPWLLNYMAGSRYLLMRHVVYKFVPALRVCRGFSDKSYYTIMMLLLLLVVVLSLQDRPLAEIDETIAALHFNQNMRMEYSSV